jgi:hypothetical protein
MARLYTLDVFLIRHSKTCTRRSSSLSIAWTSTCTSFRDDWGHQLNVVAIKKKAPAANLPRLAKRVGESPPQYGELDEDG